MYFSNLSRSYITLTTVGGFTAETFHFSIALDDDTGRVFYTSNADGDTEIVVHVDI